GLAAGPPPGSSQFLPDRPPVGGLQRKRFSPPRLERRKGPGDLPTPRLRRYPGVAGRRQGLRYRLLVEPRHLPLGPSEPGPAVADPERSPGGSAPPGLQPRRRLPPECRRGFDQSALGPHDRAAAVPAARGPVLRVRSGRPGTG